MTALKRDLLATTFGFKPERPALGFIVREGASNSLGATSMGRPPDVFVLHAALRDANHFIVVDCWRGSSSP